MAYEGPFTGKYIDDLNPDNPEPTDVKSLGDDHIRGIKLVLQNTFSAISGEVTADEAELNKLDGVTATTAELNILDGVTSTTAELNILDGVTSTAAELNILDGVTATATELNYLDGPSPGSNVASKAPVLDAQKDLELGTGDVNCTIVGCTTVNASGTVTGGTVTGGTVTDGTASLNGGALTGLTTPLTQAQGGTGTTSIRQWTYLDTFDTTSSATLGSNTSVPSTTTGIKVLFNGVSASSTGQILVMLGRGGTPTYDASGTGRLSATSGSGSIFASNGIRTATTITSSSTLYGTIELFKLNATNEFSVTVSIGSTGTTDVFNGGGVVTLSAALTAIKITVAAGTFDAGSVDVYTYS